MSLVTPKKEAIPTSRRGRGAGDPAELEAAQLLRDNGGESFRLFEFDKPSAAQGLAQQIRRGQRAAFREGFTASARTIDGKGVVFVTYVGYAPSD